MVSWTVSDSGSDFSSLCTLPPLDVLDDKHHVVSSCICLQASIGQLSIISTQQPAFVGYVDIVTVTAAPSNDK